jgi:hypothetical protein
MRPPAPENSARITGCLLRRLFWKILAAPSYRSNMALLRARTSLVATSEGAAVVLPEIGSM